VDAVHRHSPPDLHERYYRDSDLDFVYDAVPYWLEAWSKEGLTSRWTEPLTAREILVVTSSTFKTTATLALVSGRSSLSR
jgi:hypothetical protein